jgi:RNA polymerase sigma factor (sigma-70 family)
MDHSWNGSPQEIEDIIERHNNTLNGYASWFLHKYPSITAQKEDLVGWGAIGLIKAYRDYDECKGATIGTWVSRNVFWFMYNGLKEWHGHSGGFPRKEPEGEIRADEIGFDDVYSGYEPSQSEDQPERYISAEIISDVSRLPRRLGRVIVMRYWHDKPLKEIARAERCSREYARQLVVKAVEELRKMQRYKDFKRVARQCRARKEAIDE